VITVLLFGIFAILLIVGAPIAVSLGVAALACLSSLGVPLSVMPQRVFTSLDSFPIMAIPFFVLAGNLMTEGGISKRLISFANSIIGTIKGGLAMASILACGFFAALSGSGPATVIAIGSMMYPEMVKRNYPKDYAAGIVTVAGGLGPIIPPSIIMVVYCTLTDTSIGDLFLSGTLVGAAIMLALLIVTYILAKKRDWPVEMKSINSKQFLASFKDALFALFMPVIILGGIYGGIFTPTEAACIAVVYSFIISVFVYKEIKLKDVPRILKQSAIGCSVVLFIIGTSSLFAWLFAYAGISNQLVGLIMSTNLSYTTLLIMITLVLFVFGFFLEGIATVILLMPIMFPLAMQLGIHPLHLGMIVTMTNVLGQMTPPVAVNIFACATYSKLPVETISKGEIPFFLTVSAMLVLVVAFPQLTLLLPNLF